MVTTPTVWKAREQVTQSGTGNQNDAQIVGREDGGWYVVWVDTTNSALMARSFDAEGNALTGDISIGLPGNDTDPAVALLPGDILAVAFANDSFGDNDILVRQVDKMLASVALHTINGTASETIDPSITVLSDGSYVVSYTIGTGDDTDVAFRIVNFDATAISPEVLVLDSDFNSGGSQVATLSNGNFVVVYQDEFETTGADIDVKFKIFSPTGTEVDADNVATTLRLEDDPHVAALAGGGFVVVWHDDEGDGPGDHGIKATVYDNAGDEVNNFIQVNTSTAGNQSDPRVAALADGGFVAVWTDSGSGVIRGQRFDATGVKVGIEFTENFSVEDNPVVAGLSDGRFIVGFEDVDDAPTDVDIHATIFDPRTSPINGDANANVITSRKDGATVNGLGGSDTLLGQEQADILNGGTGADVMRGRGGDDTYVVDNVGDQVIEAAGQGTDTVASSVSFTLGANVEYLGLSGTANISGTGNGLANILVGNSGNNALFGGDGADGIDGMGGADDMRGGTGDDTYFVDNAGDGVTEFAGQGTDTVASSIAFTLGANVENLVLTGSAKINGTGNNLANTLVGNAGKNTLNGGGAADTISGGLGKDKLLGKGGKDMFVFADALGPANADKLKDFKHKKDKILLDQDIFAAVGTKVGKKEFVEGKKAGDKNDHIIRDGKKVFYDADGKGGAKQVLFAKIDKEVDLDHKDFMVDDFVI
ncbi:calcium-binding protein [Bauldia litoralis]|uniref:calcium-binding protein n=1 Tax=Bauldia litoralis TaxID=665467 RepID=UPI0032646FFE